jgi:hypothetical protein
MLRNAAFSCIRQLTMKYGSGDIYFYIHGGHKGHKGHGGSNVICFFGWQSVIFFDFGNEDVAQYAYGCQQRCMTI